MKRQIKAVLFDLDGVVVFTDKYHYLAWKKLADEQGWEFDEEVNNGCRGVPRMASLQVILDHNGVALAEDEKVALATRKNEYYKELLDGIGEDDLYPGVVDFLEALREEGVRLGLCSSSKNALTVLRALDLEKYFEAVVTGNDITRAKPDPQIFLLGAGKLRVPPFHCIVFEDAPSGVAAGLAAGMKVIGVGSPGLLTEAPECIDDYAAIDIGAMLDTGRTRRPAPEPWVLAETRPDPRRAQYWETVFALTNGYMGLRGTFEEEDPALAGASYPGFFINGIYDYEPYEHVVSFPGFPEHRHAMLNLCDWRIMNLFVGGERFSIFDGHISDYRRELDMKRGVVTRSLHWQSPGGRRVELRTTRVVSMARRHCAGIRYEVTPVGWSGEVRLESVVTTDVPSQVLPGRHAEAAGCDTDGTVHRILLRTKSAPFAVGMAFAHRMDAGPCDVDARVQHRGERLEHEFVVRAQAGAPIVLDKLACFHTTLESPDGDVLGMAEREMEDLRQEGFEALRAGQAAFWADYWDLGDVRIDGNVADQQALRFSLFHLRQGHPEDDLRSIGANGVTGDKYCGHVFWDTELYISPHFLYTDPATVRPLLMYRYGLLSRARERAEQMAGKGALFSWNSISGEECGVVYEAATAEYHLLSDIALAIDRYVRATGDEDFLFDCGAEILFDTARFLADRGAFVPLRDGRFCINAVCGPDEYGCGVNNNCYTNMLAQWHFRYACSVFDRMAAERPGAFNKLCGRLKLGRTDRETWQRCADDMYIPFNEELGIHAQDDSFLYLDPVDMELVPRNTDLRDVTHPLNLWRMQVAKQADVVLLMFVLGDRFSPEVKRANYEFYEPRTCHGSSLSPCVHSIVAAEVGKLEDAYDYWRLSANMDLNDFKNNTGGGVHSACLGGTWMAVVNGFAGMRDYEDGLVMNPRLPAAWEGYAFNLRYRGSLVRVDVNRDGVTYDLADGPELAFRSGGEEVALTRGAPQARCPLA